MTQGRLAALKLVSEGRFFPTFRKENGVWHARWQAADGSFNRWVDGIVREGTITPLCRDAENQHYETLHDAFIAALKSETGIVVWDEAQCEAFAEDLRHWHEGVDISPRKRVVFTLEQKEGAISLSTPLPRDRRTLRAVGEATFVCGTLRSLKLEEGGVLRARLSPAEADVFAKYGAADLEAAGFKVQGLDRETHISFSGEIATENVRSAKSAQAEFKLVVRVDGEEVGIDEVKFLLDQNSSFVWFRDRFIKVDRAILKNAYRALGKREPEKLPPSRAVSLAMGIGLYKGLEIERPTLRGWIRSLVGNLKAQGHGAIDDFSQPAGFEGVLRGYQRRGAAWMKFLTDNGFGALLADDMGLGKTVQAIALMLASGDGPHLVVAPLTLLANWRHEIARFAPDMGIVVHHGGNRAIDPFSGNVCGKGVVLTSYSLIVKDFGFFSRIKWKCMILDEAQAIKNSSTLISQAVRALRAERRVAMTGTPIENSVADIWSIEEFLNKSLFGPKKEFESKFSPVMGSSVPATAAKLRHLLEPFVLRRLKSDKNIAAEIGPKHIVKEYCSLGFGEKRDYENALADYRSSSRKRGDAFALITKLKLICDGESKIERLCELVESILASGESALVFSQYVKVGALLVARLEKRFGINVPFLHGSLSAREREQAVAAFTETSRPSLFVLSLKAGGYGLNLTKASHVIHFDRWWNPAVENQATDRTHRIGQTKPVFVHTMITTGTLEERVDELISSKSRFAQEAVASGESYLMSLAPADLLKLTELS